MKNLIDIFRIFLGHGVNTPRYHLMHVMLDSRVAHGLNGYYEVIETIRWGLEQLGNKVSYAINHHDPGAINIVFGAQLLPVDVLSQLPPNTIIYNFEQARNVDARIIKQSD